MPLSGNVSGVVCGSTGRSNYESSVNKHIDYLTRTGYPDTIDERKPVGIDLGTTRSAIATVVNEEPEILENMEGSELTPNVVRVDGTDEAIVGQEASNAAAQYPDQTVSEIKRDMGTESIVTLNGREFLPEQISALILEQLVGDATERLGRDVSEAVITVPAYFGERERSATKSAAEIAGLERRSTPSSP